ncbi:MAG: hypothetical protein KIT73_03910, partial [Burkholderiales bacterium]|nr:hypothetical protein [Burkholderiales bacterium]
DRMIPAIALTAFVRPEDRRQALHAGYQAHLGKPFETHELVNLAAKLAARSPDDPGSSPTPLP